MKPEIKISEADHQKTVIEWASWNEKKYPCLRFLYACPNEGKHKVQYRVHQKAMGVKAGVPDLFLPYPVAYLNYSDPIGLTGGSYTLYCNGSPAYKYCGLYIEMKTKGGSVSKPQKEWIAYLKEAGYRVEVCWSAEEAIKIIEDYMGI